MDKEFPKKYDHKLESKIYQGWLDKDLFTPESVEKIKGKSNERFFISMPPPNVTGVLHLGHSMMLAIEDVMVRFARMKGKKTLWIPGTDHAGIATQVVVERKLVNELKKSRYELGRERFLEKIWEWVKYSRSSIIDQIKMMGASCDWSREQFTLSEKLSRGVRKAFIDLYDKGKIYKDTYIVNWCTKDHTVLSDLEVEYDEVKAKMYYIRYFIEGKGDFITVATVRPETVFGDVAIAVNPKDRRYKKYIGKNVLIPIINRPIPIISDDHVDMGFGSGALKITPAHDLDDFIVGKRHNLPLNQFAIDKYGNMTSLSGTFAGKKVEDVYENIIQYITDIGNMEKVIDYDTKIPYCHRCRTRIQPMISNQWFLKVDESVQKIKNVIDNKQVNIYPQRFNKSISSFLEEIKPWCISRQLRWGHRIPVWICPEGHYEIFDEDVFMDSLEIRTDLKAKAKSKNKGKKSVLAMIIFNLIADSRLNNPFNLEEFINVFFSDSLTVQEGKIYDVYLNIYRLKFKDNKDVLVEIGELYSMFELINQSGGDIVKYGGKLVDVLDSIVGIVSVKDQYKLDMCCSKCGSRDMLQDEDVLDTWFSSGLWPFSILGRPENSSDMKEFYPNDVLETGYDIIFFWVARMMMMGFEQTNQSPFNNIYLHGLIRDEQGRKMSKVTGNVINSDDVIEKYGADALRLTLLVGITPGNDLKFSESKVQYYWRFMNKLWNACRFVYISVFEKDSEISIDYDNIRKTLEKKYDKLNDFDKWIISKVNSLISDSEKYMDKYLLGELVQTAINMVWHEFCDWYLEISKIEKSDYTDTVLIYSIGTILKCLHPFIPFITENLWHLLRFDGDLIISNFPSVINKVENNSKLNLLMDMISDFRTLRNNSGLKPHEKVDVFIQGNTSFLGFTKKYIGLIEKLINTGEIKFTKDELENSDDYDISIIMDIKIGLKGIKEVNWINKIEILEKQLRENQQFLQNIRNLMATPGFVDQAPQNVIKEKQQKMDEVKSTIIKLEHEINKLRMNNK